MKKKFIKLNMKKKLVNYKENIQMNSKNQKKIMMLVYLKKDNREKEWKKNIIKRKKSIEKQLNKLERRLLVKLKHLKNKINNKYYKKLIKVLRLKVKLV